MFYDDTGQLTWKWTSRSYISLKKLSHDSKSSEKLLTETFPTGVKHVVFEKKDVEFQDTHHYQHFLEFSEYQDSQSKKNRYFSLP